jgi:tRNA dimethylallyltransferase
VRLAERGRCEIISVDSAMVYRGMDIGTAKPDGDTLARAPHRLIDILDPADAYSAGRFVTDALREMGRHPRRRGASRCWRGGTMLYFRALQRGLAPLPAACARVRAQIDREAETGGGWPAMHEALSRADPVTASRVHPNDAQRIQRALEVFRLTGSPMSVLQAATAFPVLLLSFLEIRSYGRR